MKKVSYYIFNGEKNVSEATFSIYKKYNFISQSSHSAVDFSVTIFISHHRKMKPESLHILHSQFVQYAATVRPV